MIYGPRDHSDKNQRRAIAGADWRHVRMRRATCQPHRLARNGSPTCLDPATTATSSIGGLDSGLSHDPERARPGQSYLDEHCSRERKH